MVTLGLCLEPPDTLDVSRVGGRIVRRSDESRIPDLTVVTMINCYTSAFISILVLSASSSSSPEDQLWWHHSHRPPCGLMINHNNYYHRVDCDDLILNCEDRDRDFDD